MLMWYTHEEIILINSLDQDNTWLLERIQKNLVKFLKNLDCCVRSIAVKKEAFISQNDFSSCGVCTCIAADAISANALNKIENTDTKDYRSWLIYSLVKNCVACHPVLKKHLEMTEEKEIDSDTSVVILYRSLQVPIE